MKRTKAIGTLFGLAMAFATALPAAAQKTDLTIYTALENDQLAPFKQSIEAAVPGVNVVWVRDSTGVITARFLAEKDNPRADMVIGLAASSLLLFEKMNLLETYKPAGVEKLKPAFADSKDPYTWTGMDASSAWYASTPRKPARPASRRRPRGKTCSMRNTRASW
jgi:iron(III) transport system substrate-binding protein